MELNRLLHPRASLMGNTSQTIDYKTVTVTATVTVIVIQTATVALS